MFEQHREKGRFVPVFPRNVQNTPGVSPRDTFSQNVKKHTKMKYDIHKEDTEMKEEKKMKGPDPCWKGYEMIGKKMKNGRSVPNCVPVKEENINESDLPTTKEKEKIVTVKHRTSGKELDIVHTAVGKYKKLGYEPVNEEADIVDEMAGANMDTRAVHKHLKKGGWNLTRTKGGHDVFTHQKSPQHIAVPRHRQLKAPLIRGILKTASSVNESKTASIARGILMRKIDTMKLLKTPKPAQPKEPQKPAEPKMTTEELSRKAQIVKKAAKKGKDKFEADPVITQSAVKTVNGY